MPEELEKDVNSCYVSRVDKANIVNPKASFNSGEQCEANLDPGEQCEAFGTVVRNSNNLSQIQFCFDTHFDSRVLLSGTILIVAREEDKFECPECWRQWDREQTFFCKLISFVKHIVSLSFTIFDKQNGYLPQDPAKG